MQDKPIAPVTGANEGIGLQIAKDLAAHGPTMLVGSRKLEDGETAAKSVGTDARGLQLSVTDHASIAAAAGRIRDGLGCLDVLVNNAGIPHAGTSGTSLEEIAKTGRTRGRTPRSPRRGRSDGHVLGRGRPAPVVTESRARRRQSAGSGRMQMTS